MNQHDANPLPALQESRKDKLTQPLREMRADLTNLQKSASCALVHLEQILQLLEAEP